MRIFIKLATFAVILWIQNAGAGSLWYYNGSSASELHQAAFDTYLGGNVEVIDLFDDTILWGAGGNTIALNGTSNHYTFNDTVTGVQGFFGDQAYVTLANGELWYYNGSSASELHQAAFDTYLGGNVEVIDLFDDTILWGAGGNTIALNGTSNHYTFNDTVTGVQGFFGDQAYVTLANGELWYYNGSSASELHQAAFDTYLGGNVEVIDLFDDTILWGAGGNTIALNGTSNHYTFNDTVTGVQGFFGDQAYVVTSPAVVPVPPAAWLFGSALGILGWMRRRTLH